MTYEEIVDILKRDNKLFDVSNPVSGRTKEMLDLFMKKRNSDALLSIDEAMLIGVYNYKKRLFHDAADYFNRAMSLENNNELAVLNAAITYENMNDMEKAEFFYDKALRMNPENVYVISSFAVFYKRCKKDFKKAEEYFEKCILIDGNNPLVLSNYALFVKEIKGDFDLAEDYLKKAIKADPGYTAALGNYALFLREVREDFEKAEGFFKRAIDADPEYAVALGNYALFLREVRDNFNDAEVYFRRAVEADPDSLAHLGNLAYLLFEMNKFDEAVEIYNRLLKQEAADWIYFNIGHTLLAMNKTGEAQAAYTKGLLFVDSLNRLEELMNSELKILKEKSLIDTSTEKDIKKELREALIKKLHDC